MNLEKTLEVEKSKVPVDRKRSGEWPKIRAIHLKQNPACAVCGGIEKLQVHHIRPFHIHPELELDPANFITLCEANKDGFDCHLGFGHLGNFKSFNTTVSEDAVFGMQKSKPDLWVKLMPTAPRKPCRQPGCKNLSTNTYCGQHEVKRRSEAVVQRKRYDNERGTAASRGYNSKWSKLSKSFRLANPLCEECKSNGIMKLAECVDHIIPHKGDQELFWDLNNLQSLCFVHHSAKTAREDGAFGNTILRGI